MKFFDKIWGNLKNRIIMYVIKLGKKGYIIPADTKNHSLFTQNEFVNASVFVADLICIIITLYGLNEQLITLFGVITYTVYTLCDQVKIVIQQTDKKKGKNGYFECKNYKKSKYEPNKKYVFIILIIFISLVVLSINKATGGNMNIHLYYTVILSSFSILFKIKVEYMLLDVLGITNWKFIEESYKNGKEVKL